jgi:polysaccharide transporter, PST family
MDALWLKYLPRYVRSKLAGRQTLQAALGNSGWLAVDRMLRIGIGAVLTIWLARYLGPDRYGQLSYAIGFASLFGAIASWGMNGIIVRDLVRFPDEKNALLASSLALRLLGGTLSFLLALIVIQLLRPTDIVTQWLVGIIAAAMIFQSSEVIEFWFQSQVQSRYAVYCKGTTFLALSAVKLWLILIHADLIAFALVFLTEYVITAVILVLVFRGTGNSLCIQGRRYPQAKRLLRESWSLMLSNVAVMLYMRIDIVMLREMKGESAAGIYAAATVISEAGYFLPAVIVASAFPAIIKYRENDPAAYRISLKKLYFVLFWLAVCVVVPLSLFSGWIIRVLYGVQFQDATPVLTIHLWASIPLFLAIASEHYLLAESMQKFVFLRSLVGAGVNVLLNILLIPGFGVIGAAFATLISYAFIMISLMFWGPTRKHCVFLLAAIARRTESRFKKRNSPLS